MTEAARRRTRQRIRIIKIQWLLILALTVSLIISIATRPAAFVETLEATQPTATMPTQMPTPTTVPTPTPTYAPQPVPYTDEEVTAIALTLAGECYDDMTEDKRKVAEVIVNRVSAGTFGKTVLAVVSAPYQFAGYQRQSRPVSDNDIEVAKTVLQAWYDGGCKALSDLLFFSSGENRENVFRTTFE